MKSPSTTRPEVEWMLGIFRSAIRPTGRERELPTSVKNFTEVPPPRPPI